MIQIRKDILLDIHSVHPITCPLINPLIFHGDKCTKVYEIELTYNPENLYVYSDDLIEAISDLKQWTHDVINLYTQLPDESKENKSYLDIPELIEAVEELLNNDYNNFYDQEKKINRYISAWESQYKEAIEYQNSINQQKQTIIELKDSLSDLRMGESDYEGLSINIMHHEEELKQTNRLYSMLEHQFDQDLRDSLEYQFKTYSDKLEYVRFCNDNLREETTSLRDCLIMNFKEELNCFQPDEYLNKKFGITDFLSKKNALNLGIIHNNSTFITMDGDTENNDFGEKYFLKLVNELRKKDILTYTECSYIKDRVEPFMLKAEYQEKFGISKEESRQPEYRVNLLLSLLKDKGFDIIRYYEKHEDYLNNRNSFKTVDLSGNQPLKKINKKLNI